jgi:hypothetical protein
MIKTRINFIPFMTLVVILLFLVSCSVRPMGRKVELIQSETLTPSNPAYANATYYHLEDCPFSSSSKSFDHSQAIFKEYLPNCRYCKQKMAPVKR